MKMVEDWKSAWRWFSVQALTIIAAIPLVWPMIPPDVQAWLPEQYRPYVILALALGGIVGRVVDYVRMERVSNPTFVVDVGDQGEQFARLLERAGRIPPPPEELAGAPLKIEYTSILAQAAKANGTSSIERVIQFAAGVAQATGNTDALDKIDADQAIDEYADRVGSPASMLRDDDAVAQIRATRASA